MGLARLLTSNRGRSLFLPAHGRGLALPAELKKLLSKRAGIWDLPDLPDIGGPIDSCGAVAISQKDSADGMGAQRGWYGVNGATGLLQSALLAIARPGQAVLIPRNVHRSIINACIIGGLIPVIFDLPFMPDRGHVVPFDGNWLKKILEALDLEKFDIAAAVLVHPSYQGYANDLKPLVKQLHEMGWPVLVDEAHGTHFAACTTEGLPSSALTAGADLIVHSLHKSGLGLVQTAVLWMQGDRVDPIAIERSIGWLQTSSPSSLLIVSCESALSEWRMPLGKKKLRERICKAREIAYSLRKLGLPLIENQDPLRLVLHTASQGINGLKADAIFISRGLVAELPEPGCITFCLGLAKHNGLIKCLKNRWDEILSAGFDQLPSSRFSSPPIPLLNIPQIQCSTASRAPWKFVPISQAVGKISAEMVCPYPPGIPMLIPGEALDQSRVNWLIEQQKLWSDQIPSKLKVLC